MGHHPKSYAFSLAWLALNDDNHYLDSENSGISVTASLVADIYSKSDEQIREDLTSYIKKLKATLD